MLIRIPTPSLLTYLNGHKPKLLQLTIIDLKTSAKQASHRNTKKEKKKKKAVPHKELQMSKTNIL